MFKEQTAVGASAGGTIIGWLTVANEYLQFIALIVSIIAGGIAIWSYWRKRGRHYEGPEKGDK